MSGLPLYLDMTHGAESGDARVEVRVKTPHGMRQHPILGHDRQAVVDLVKRVSPRTDVYIGVAPRTARPCGGKDAVERVHVLYVDCDTQDAIAALEEFDPVPSMIVNSGRGRHAYWSLAEPAAPVDVEQANRRLAAHLGADLAATDCARILRPPGSFNHKTNPPLPVEIVAVNIEIYAIADVVGEIPQLEEATNLRRLEPRDFPIGDALNQIPPAVYVEALTGRVPNRAGKLCCPFHDDSTPSLQVYDDPQRGWVCFGCGKGGTVIDFGAALYGLAPRGGEFFEIQRRLVDQLLAVAA